MNNQNQVSSADNVLSFVCPNCGSTQVHKSFVGKAEHAAAWGGVKLLKTTVMGDYGRYTGGIENNIIKDEVPFQQVCDYCHRTFHARKSQIEAGAYSMNKNKADRLMESYNKKLQKVKDREVEEIKERASKVLNRTVIYGLIFSVGLLICCGCEHTTEGIFGMSVYTGTFIFSCFLMAVGGGLTLVSGISCANTYNEATELENTSIQEYAKTHSAE